MVRLTKVHTSLLIAGWVVLLISIPCLVMFGGYLLIFVLLVVGFFFFLSLLMAVVVVAREGTVLRLAAGTKFTVFASIASSGFFFPSLFVNNFESRFSYDLDLDIGPLTSLSLTIHCLYILTLFALLIIFFERHVRVSFSCKVGLFVSVPCLWLIPILLVSRDKDVLHKVANSGDIFWCRTLVSFGADPNARTNSGITALSAAVVSGNVSLVDYFISCGGDVNNIDNMNGTPLSYAVRRGDITLVAMLIRKGAKISPNALYEAVRNRSHGIFEVLLNSGGNISEADDSGVTTLDKLVADDDLEGVAMLLNYEVNQNTLDNALSYAVRNDASDNEAIVRLLLRMGANVDKRPEFILVACQSRDASFVELLLKYGASPNKVDWFGDPSFFYAKDTSVARMLVKYGGNVDILNNSGKPPIFDAIEDRDVSMIEFYITQGANINIVDIYGNNAFHHAAETCYSDSLVIEKLLSSGINPYQKNKEGNTALEIAVKLGCTETAKLFQKKTRS